MKRVSKYEHMVGTEVNGVFVSNYRRIEKVSKTSGRKYYRYEVELNNVLWVSTTSFNKGSYTKRLTKAMGEAPKAKAKAKAKRTYKKEAKRDLPCGLTEEQCKAYIKKYGYAFIVTPEGTFTAPEYEAMKAKDEDKRQEEAEAELRKYEQERRDMVLDSIFEKVLPKCQEWFEEYTNTKEFNNINVLGGIKWETPQELMNRVLKALKYLAKENDDEYFQITLAVWCLFYQDKYEAWVSNNWDKLWSITRKQWQQWRDENLGKGWEDNWKFFNGKEAEQILAKSQANEFDSEFEGCTNMKEVKAIYRRLAKQNHPDQGGTDEQMKELSKAYDKWCYIVGDGSKVARAEHKDASLEDLLDELLAEVEAELRGAFLLA